MRQGRKGLTDPATPGLPSSERVKHLEIGPECFNQTEQYGGDAEQVVLGEEKEDHLLGDVDYVDEDEAVQEHGKLVLGQQEVLKAS